MQIHWMLSTHRHTEKLSADHLSAFVETFLIAVLTVLQLSVGQRNKMQIIFFVLQFLLFLFDCLTVCQ